MQVVDGAKSVHKVAPALITTCEFRVAGSSLLRPASCLSLILSTNSLPFLPDTFSSFPLSSYFPRLISQHSLPRKEAFRHAKTSHWSAFCVSISDNTFLYCSLVVFEDILGRQGKIRGVISATEGSGRCACLRLVSGSNDALEHRHEWS